MNGPRWSNGHERRNRHGSVLVLAGLLMVVIFAFACLTVDVGYVALARTQLQNSADMAALAAATAVADRNIETVRTTAKDVALANRAAGKPVNLQPTQDVEIGYWNRDTASFVPLAAGAIDEADAVRVTCRLSKARGNQLKLFFGAVIGTSEAEVQAQAIARCESSMCGRLVGLQSVVVKNTMTDSYHSARGSYSSQPHGEKGHVCSDGPVTISHAVVHGMATCGQNSAVTLLSGGMATKGTSKRTRPIDAPAIDVGSARTQNDNSRIGYTGGSLSISGGELKVPGGTYFFDGNVSVSGNARITFLAPAIVYITGTLSMSGNGFVNQLTSPKDLQLYVMGSSVKFTGTSDFYGVIYAPAADMTITGNAHVFGAVLGRTLSIDGNAGIHYDEAIDPFDQKFRHAVLSR